MDLSLSQASSPVYLLFTAISFVMKLTVYHGTECRPNGDMWTNVRPVESMIARRSDFSAARTGFWVTPSKQCAEGWASGIAMSDSNLIVMEFELDLSGLNVYDFGIDKQGEQFAKWKELITWSWTNENRIDHPEFKDYDAIIGFTSQGTVGTHVSLKIIRIAGEDMIQIGLLSDKAVSHLKFVRREVVLSRG